MEMSWLRVLRCVRCTPELQSLLSRMGVDSTDMVLACSETSGEEFRRGLLALAAPLTPPEGGWAHKIEESQEQLDYLFEVVLAMGASSSAQNARDFMQQMHIGQSSMKACMDQPRCISNVPQARSRTPTSRRYMAAPVRANGGTALRDIERAHKHMWVQRLLAIYGRAGKAARVTEDLEPAAKIACIPIMDLIESVLGRGAWRTIRGHVLAWERFEKWAREISNVFPPTLPLLVAFAACLQKAGCGPSVIPSLRTSVGWICRRLGMEMPDTAAEPLLAIEADIVEMKGRELREAAPIHEELLRSLEILMLEWVQQKQVVRVIRVWQLLCMIWASMRFDDALHIRPDSMQDSTHALLMVAWQTKTERKRKGTRYAVPKVGMTEYGWVHDGFDIYQSNMPSDHFSGDFWLVSGDVDHMNHTVPMSYEEYSKMLKQMLQLACDANPCGLVDKAVLDTMRESAEKATGHSPKVTVVNMMAHAGVSGTALQLQGNLRDQSMPAKYIRDRKAIPVNFLSALTRDMRKDFHPKVPDVQPVQTTCLLEEIANMGASSSNEGNEASAEQHAEDNLSVSIADPVATANEMDFCFWEAANVDASEAWRQSRGLAAELRFHVVSVHDATRLVCNTFPLRKCRPIGATWPERGKLCDRCKVARPEVMLFEEM